MGCNCCYKRKNKNKKKIYSQNKIKPNNFNSISTYQKNENIYFYKGKNDSGSMKKNNSKRQNKILISLFEEENNSQKRKMTENSNRNVKRKSNTISGENLHSLTNQNFKKLDTNNYNKDIKIDTPTTKISSDRNANKLTIRENKNIFPNIIEEIKENNITNSNKVYDNKIDSDKEIIMNKKENNNKNIDYDIISLGINIGAFKTVYSIFSKINGKYLPHVLLMNNSSRIIPSIICYTKDHRLFGENSISSLKLNLNTSYNNLSRIIGFNKNIKYYENEIKYQFNNNIKLFKFDNYKEEIKSEYLIADYLSLINDYYFGKEKINFDICSISVPDYYNPIQKKELQLICESIGMKTINIFNESSAITMYYGYTKYKDIFLNKEKKIDPNIEKNILFIDAGHSKTSFILSKFKYNEFKVEYVLCDDNLGGRNFDELIFNYCIEEFKKENKINEFIVTSKMRYRLIESIRNSRIKLTVNTEIGISVESFYNDIDLNIILKRDKFEELIKEYINKFKNNLKIIIDYVKKKKININEVEIAGEIMRTPIFQKIVENNKLKISKGILIDECCSVGASLLGNYINDKFIIQFLKNIIHYNYYNINYQIIYDNNNIIEDTLFSIGPIINQEKYINLNDKYKNKLIFKLSYSNNIFFEIDLFKILNNENISKDNYPIIKIINDNNLLSFIILIDNKEIKNINISLNNEYEYKNNIIYHIKKQKKIDSNYNYFLEEKLKLSKIYYFLKNIINANEELKDEESKINNIEIQIKKNLNKELVSDIKNKLLLMINKFKTKLGKHIKEEVLKQLNEYEKEVK